MKKDLDFVISGNKLEIVGLTDDGKAWVETLKPSSRRIKPSSAGFAIKAFKKWQQLENTQNATATININDSDDTISANAVNASLQSIPNVSASIKFAISAMILGVLNILLQIYWVFLRDDIAKIVYTRDKFLVGIFDNLFSFPFGLLTMLLAMFALRKGNKNARIMATVAILIAFVGTWLFKVISYLSLYIAA